MIAPKARKEEVFVYLVYMDDSAVPERFQVMGAVAIEDHSFQPFESYLADMIDAHVPEEQRPSFEFHASAMFHAKPPFEKLWRDDCLKLFGAIVDLVVEERYPLYMALSIYRNSKQQVWKTAKPVDMAFRLCARRV